MEKESNAVGLELRKLNILIKRKMDANSSKQYIDKLTGTHGFVLGYLHRNLDKDVFQRDIEEEFSIRRSTATTILQLMEKNGLITRQPVDYDARLKKIVMTQKAIDIHLQVHETFIEINNLLVKDIDEKDLETFYSVIKKMNENLLN